MVFDSWFLQGRLVVRYDMLGRGEIEDRI